MAYLSKKNVEDLQVAGQRVLVRCDFNVPMKEGVITNDNRIVAALPTIQYLINNKAKVILCSHMGKPKGEPKPELSLAPVAVRLSEKLGQPVVFAADDEVVGENARKAVAAMNDGDVVLKRPRTAKTSLRISLLWPICLLTTRSVRLTVPTAPPSVWRPTSRSRLTAT